MNIRNTIDNFYPTIIITIFILMLSCITPVKEIALCSNNVCRVKYSYPFYDYSKNYDLLFNQVEAIEKYVYRSSEGIVYPLFKTSYLSYNDAAEVVNKIKSSSKKIKITHYGISRYWLFLFILMLNPIIELLRVTITLKYIKIYTLFFTLYLLLLFFRLAF